MSKLDKLIDRILNNQNITFEEAEMLLKKLNFEKKITGSHHVFRKKNYEKNVSLKKRSKLLPYQIRILKEVLKDHEY